MSGMSAPSGEHRSPASRLAIRPATTRLLVLLLVTIVATGLAATVVAAKALPSCRVADVLTAQRGYADWNRTILDTTFRLASSYAPRDLRSTSAAGLNGGHSRPLAGHRRSQGHGLGRAEGRCAARGPVRVPELLHPALDVLVLDPRLGLRGGAEVQRPGRSQRAPARHDRRLPELRRIGALVLRGLGQEQGRGLAQEQCLEVRLRHVLPQGQDAPSPATRTSRGITGTSVGRWRPRCAPAA